MSDITVVHSSDLHIDGRSSESFHPLCKVVDAAVRLQADVLLLAGDIFDHNRLPLALIDRAARVLDDARIPVVILPGNHDCLAADSVYRRGGLADVPNVHVLGVTSEEEWTSPELDLEIWGRPHLDYHDYSPLADPRPRRPAGRSPRRTATGSATNGTPTAAGSSAAKRSPLPPPTTSPSATGHRPRPQAMGRYRRITAVRRT